ncbi:SAM-dependent methyltransferase [Pseudomonas fluorescens ABAC62]|nr:SAM-dependent methyltransferase [Pseudomonas fluorescens ABAC62]
MSMQFYRAFEDRHRGSRELIRERQEAYFPFIEPLRALYPHSCALDLGCGRGEWLEILAEMGFKPLGVDLDRGMLEACTERGLPVELDDALNALKKLADDSQAVVSGFHIAEHIPFDDLKTLVAEALRVLRPGGLLILETPNAENLVVGTQNFYLDPTHERPIPHLLLDFLIEFTGFSRSKLMRLHEPAVLTGDGPVDLMDVLGGTSPDYAIVAQKTAEAEQLQRFDSAFSSDYGLALDTLAKRYDTQLVQRMERRAQDLEARLELTRQHSEALEAVVHELGGRSDANLAQLNIELREVSLRAELAESRAHTIQLQQQDTLNNVKNTDSRLDDALANIEQLQKTIDLLMQSSISRQQAERALAQEQAMAHAEDLNARLNASLSNAHHWWLKAVEYETQLNAIKGSRSWRLTRSIRGSAAIPFKAATLPVRGVKRVIRPILFRSVNFVLKRPGLQQRVSGIIKAYPGVYLRLKQFALHHGIIQAVPEETTPLMVATEASKDGFATASPRVARIYSDLKLAFERKEGL